MKTVQTMTSKIQKAKTKALDAHLTNLTREWLNCTIITKHEASSRVSPSLTTGHFQLLHLLTKLTVIHIVLANMNKHKSEFLQGPLDQENVIIWGSFDACCHNDFLVVTAWTLENPNTTLAESVSEYPLEGPPGVQEDWTGSLSIWG